MGIITKVFFTKPIQSPTRRSGRNSVAAWHVTLLKSTQHNAYENDAAGQQGWDNAI